MQQDMLWMGIDEPRLEHLHLHEVGSHIIADGLVVGLADGQPLRLSYVLHCDQHYLVELATVRLLTPPSHTITLRRRSDGQWTDEHGSLLPQLRGCIDVDIAVTPFTNTLPIRRLDLAPGTAAVIEVAYVDVPSLALRAASQRYTCLQPDTGGSCLPLRESRQWLYGRCGGGRGRTRRHVSRALPAAVVIARGGALG